MERGWVCGNHRIKECSVKTDYGKRQKLKVGALIFESVYFLFVRGL